MRKESIQVSNWNDMSQFGINALTGEACTYALRLLCDVNEEGRDLIVEYFGLPYDTVLAKNWNSQVDGKPAIGSVMLSRDELRPLAHFALFRMGALAMLTAPTMAVGIFDKELLELYAKMMAANQALGYAIYRNTSTGNPHVGSRNVHAMTGRTE